jgi:hypothetical protein
MTHIVSAPKSSRLDFRLTSCTATCFDDLFSRHSPFGAFFQAFLIIMNRTYDTRLGRQALGTAIHSAAKESEALF